MPWCGDYRGCIGWLVHGGYSAETRAGGNTTHNTLLSLTPGSPVAMRGDVPVRRGRRVCRRKVGQRIGISKGRKEGGDNSGERTGYPSALCVRPVPEVTPQQTDRSPTQLGGMAAWRLRSIGRRRRVHFIDTSNVTSEEMKVDSLRSHSAATHTSVTDSLITSVNH